MKNFYKKSHTDEEPTVIEELKALELTDLYTRAEQEGVTRDQIDAVVVPGRSEKE